MDMNFTLSGPWIEFLMIFGIANIAVGLIGTALRQMGKGGMTSKRAALFIMAGALFIVCSLRYKQERAAQTAGQPAQVRTLAAGTK